ncbi:phosphatase inhibitor 2-domain-containing protein [Thamnocephalis sphaerospora]|uniref:Phosphatase inhibitor 2-domain-containing protein n=1 Tax=Thamnocephalis sphaerospora TaxID=78915 RepID=A0A4P9XWX5_9FUNG|nr:phosphatase inhibitor 2-domain-containing protein [Thamnocephalis sphaerospora]|eukprot:RKP10933.1 phosphatase inhibitor 2-domain-containing protein [Thamnocephalis sphaerospora]
MSSPTRSQYDEIIQDVEPVAQVTASSLKPPPARGILKKPSIKFEKECKSPRLKWDEASLLITEAQRGQAKMKIDEPKTPYVYYDPSKDPELQDSAMDDIDDMPPLALSEPAHLTPGAEASTARHQEDWVSDIESEDDETKHMTEEEREKHAQFEKKRAQHYNMREAMERARQLMDEEDEEDEAGDNDDAEAGANGVASSGSRRSAAKKSRRAIPPVPSLPTSH